jgi:hypothetical protein
MQERNRPSNESLSGGGIGSIFDDDESADRQLVLVTSGPHRERIPVTNMTVGEIRRRFSDRFDIDPQSAAVLDGQTVDDDIVVRAGQVLMFTHHSGEKGCAPPCASK